MSTLPGLVYLQQQEGSAQGNNSSTPADLIAGNSEHPRTCVGSASTGETPYAPLHLIRPILLKQPSLLELLPCRSVCKSWDSFICSDEFVSEYASRPQVSCLLKYCDGKLLLFHYATRQWRFIQTPFSFPKTKPSSLTNLSWPFCKKPVVMLSSWGGLLCFGLHFTTNTKFRLWNLVSNRWRDLPDIPNFDNDPSYTWIPSVAGMRLMDRHSTFQIFILCRCCFSSIVMLFCYDSVTNYWTRLSQVPSEFRVSSSFVTSCVIWKEKLYVAGARLFGGNGLLISYDMTAHSWSELACPNFGLLLSVLQCAGRLLLVGITIQFQSLQIWELWNETDWTLVTSMPTSIFDVVFSGRITRSTFYRTACFAGENDGGLIFVSTCNEENPFAVYELQRERWEQIPAYIPSSREPSFAYVSPYCQDQGILHLNLNCCDTIDTGLHPFFKGVQLRLLSTSRDFDLNLNSCIFEQEQNDDMMTN